MKQALALVLALAMLLPCTLGAAAAETETVYKITLQSQESGGSYSHTAILDGEPVPEYDYAWHADPSTAHEDVKNSPAEYYTGTAPSGEEAVYIAHDILYYPELEESKFQQVYYDGEMEWVYAYEAEGYTDYLFSTLPVLKTGFPSHMMHSEEEAYQNAVLHITQPGTYELTGQWHGQIWIDLGDEDEVYTDPDKKVTLILNGVDITCTVAPGLVFASVYECDNAWEDADSYSQNVDTSDAGANVILADGSVNNVSGTNIFRILKTKFKDEASADAYPAQKKAWKIDGAFYSYMSMNITGQTQGTGVLNITSGFEGLGSEHHLTLNGGNVNICSQDDGINVNEDGVSVLTVNGGSLHICAGLGSEGDGIDSNGFLVINGGTVIASANPASDSGLDSDCGSFVNGGTVVALGSTMDWAEADGTGNSAQPVLNLRFAGSQSADEAIVITDTRGQVVFAYDPDKDEITGDNRRTYQGAILSAPGLEIGGEYHIYIGGDVTGTEVSGVYDVTTVTGFSGAEQQGWSNNVIGGMGGRGGMGSMERPGTGGREDLTPPDGFGGKNLGGRDGGQGPDEAPELPEDFDRMQQPGDGMNSRPDGAGKREPDGAGRPEGDMDFSMGSRTGAACTYETVFPMTEQVNAFSSVSDVRHELQAAEDGSGYVCTACGQTFQDAQGTAFSAADTPVKQEAAPEGANSGIWICLGAAAVLAGGIGAALLLRKRRGNGETGKDGAL